MGESSHPDSGISTEYEEAIEVTTDPVKLLPYAPDVIKDALKEHYKTDPAIYEIEEYKLEKYLGKIEQNINDRDDALRARFWYCHDKAAYLGKKMSVHDLCAGIMHPQIFYAQYVKNRFKMAWVVCKPSELKIQDVALLTLGKRKMSEYLRMDAKDPVTNKIDYKLVGIQMAIYRNLENRVFGLPTQKIESKNMNVEISAQEMAKELENKDATELRNRLQDLKTAGMKVLPLAKASIQTPASSPGQPLTVEIKKNE